MRRIVLLVLQTSSCWGSEAALHEDQDSPPRGQYVHKMNIVRISTGPFKL